MGSFSLAHWVVVLFVVLILFGARRLSEVGKGLGEGIRSFKDGLGGDDATDRAQLRDDNDKE
jgi:sec-independent protein translocase protein TatA